MKRTLRKQVIVPMNSDVAKHYTKDSSMHIININHALKNIKLNIIADFICSNNKGIIITTNNVVSPLDLQEIKKYVKNSLITDVKQISTSKFP